MTWHSFGSGPPPAGVKQFVAPKQKKRLNLNRGWTLITYYSQFAPQTFGKAVCSSCCCCSNITCCCSTSRWSWCSGRLLGPLGQKTDFTSTFLPWPIQIVDKVIAPSQRFVVPLRSRGVAEVFLVRIPKRRGTRIEIFIIVVIVKLGDLIATDLMIFYISYERWFKLGLRRVMKCTKRRSRHLDRGERMPVFSGKFILY